MVGKLNVFYGANGAGKTTIARYFATKHRALHIQLDWFSSMHRGREWHTRKNNKDKINLLLGTLDTALNKTNYRLFFVDGVLIYPFMFRMIDLWCNKNNIELNYFKLIGETKELGRRVVKRKKSKVDWNKKLPLIYKKFTYKNSVVIDTTKESVDRIYPIIEARINA